MSKTSSGKVTPLMKQYYEIKSKYPGMVLLFRLGDFYEMFGEDALQAAPVLELVLTKRAGVPMCGVPCHSINSYIRKLITSGLKAAVCEQLEEPGCSKNIVKRGVTKIITPGTILDDTLLDAKENNFLMAVVFDECTMSGAFAAADISTGEFFASDTSLKLLEAEISRYKPGELLISRGIAGNKQIQDFIRGVKIPVSNIDDHFFDFEKAKEAVIEHFGGKIFKEAGLNQKDIIRSCGALLSYIKEMQPMSVDIFSYIKYVNKSDFMYLDTAAVKNLELLKSLASGKFENSLLSIMDSAETAMGARTVRSWLIKPLLNVSEIESRQNAVNFFIEHQDIRKDITGKFKFVSDIERIIARISSGTANPRDLSALKNSLKIISAVSDILCSAGGLFCNIPDSTEIIEKISVCIADEPPLSLKDGNVIKSGVNAELDELRKISADAKGFISNLEADERKSSGINNLKIGYTSVYGYYIEVSRSNVPLVPKHYIRRQTVTGGERYITDELKTLEEKILSSQEKIFRLENTIFNSLRQEISLYSACILKISRIISEIDVLCGFASNALEYNYVCPKVSNNKDMYIKDGRHPVVERILKNGEFIANDISFNESSRIVILTGPNMSGKSTYLRTAALIVIMAQMGSFVPASEAEIGIVDRIFTRIGAGDNLAGGESTFMVEMTETANILNQYTHRSLIILDEVGRGTSTYDGMSIAWSIIEFFADIKREVNDGVKVLFATHYFELTKLSETLKGVVNFSVDVKEWNGDVVFLHKIVKGSTDKSYGIHVAKIAGLPRRVVNRAYDILSRFETDSPAGPEKISSQMEFSRNSCPQERKILTDLEKIDINTLSPVNAFNIIKDWKDKYS